MGRRTVVDGLGTWALPFGTEDAEPLAGDILVCACRLL